MLGSKEKLASELVRKLGLKPLSQFNEKDRN
jgi:hypothetical protein